MVCCTVMTSKKARKNPKNIAKNDTADIKPSKHVTVRGIAYEQIPLHMPRLIEAGENLDNVLKQYVQPHVQYGDWLAISSKVVSVTQNRVRHISTVHVTPLARLIEKGVKKHSNMTAWSKPEKIQVAIEEAGVARIIPAMIIGGIGKLFGIRGLFWIIAGHRVSEIDGFIPEDMPPYTELAVLPPDNPQDVCNHIEKTFGVPALLSDANFINVKMLAVSPGTGLTHRIARKILLNNPFGQGDKMTPFILIRKSNQDQKNSMTIRQRIKRHTPWPLHYLYRKIYYAPKDLPSVFRLLVHSTKSPTSFLDRLRLVYHFYKISYVVDCPHTEHELLTIARTILNLGDGVPGSIVEAGVYHGGSTAKLSRVAALCGRRLEAFDSFEGMPENAEEHGKSIYGREHHFPKGSHAVSLEEVERNVTRYGYIKQCSFHRGWFSDTLPELTGPVALACMNGDLVQSTKDCLHHLVPRLSSGGIIFSQDGHFPWIIDLLEDKHFWKDEIGIAKPHMEGLTQSKLVAIFPTAKKLVP